MVTDLRTEYHALRAEGRRALDAIRSVRAIIAARARADAIPPEFRPTRSLDVDSPISVEGVLFRIEITAEYDHDACSDHDTYGKWTTRESSTSVPYRIASGGAYPGRNTCNFFEPPESFDSIWKYYRACKSYGRHEAWTLARAQFLGTLRHAHAFAEGDASAYYVDARIYFGDDDDAVTIAEDSCGGIDGDLDDYMDGECIVERLLATADAWKTDQLTNHGPYAAEITRRLLRC